MAFKEGKAGEAYVVEARLRSGGRLLDRAQPKCLVFAILMNLVR